jgi:hypothetical protein
MCKDQKCPVPLVAVQTLTGVVILVTDASFAIRAALVTLRFRDVEGQRDVLARLVMTIRLQLPMTIAIPPGFAPDETLSSTSVRGTVASL